MTDGGVSIDRHILPMRLNKVIVAASVFVTAAAFVLLFAMPYNAPNTGGTATTELDAYAEFFSGNTSGFYDGLTVTIDDLGFGGRRAFREGGDYALFDVDGDGVSECFLSGIDTLIALKICESDIYVTYDDGSTACHEVRIDGNILKFKHKTENTWYILYAPDDTGVYAETCSFQTATDIFEPDSEYYMPAYIYYREVSDVELAAFSEPILGVGTDALEWRDISEITSQKRKPK